MSKRKTRKLLRNSRGQFVSRDDYNAARAELKARRADKKAVKAIGKATAHRTREVDSFLNRAFDGVRKPDYEKKRKRLRAGTRRDAPVRAQARSEHRVINVKHFRSYDRALFFLRSLLRRRNIVVWWSVTARLPNGSLFAYQSPVGDPSNAERRFTLSKYVVASSGLNTDARLRMAVESKDLRISVYWLKFEKPKGAKKRVKAKKSMGTRKRSKRRAARRRSRSRA